MSGYWRLAGRTAWRAMGRWRWIWVALVLISIALTPIAGPSPSRWVDSPPVSEPDAGVAALETHARAGAPNISMRLSVQADYWIYRINSDPWKEAEDKTVMLDVPRPSSGSTLSLEACTREATCWLWTL